MAIRDLTEDEKRACLAFVSRCCDSVRGFFRITQCSPAMVISITGSLFIEGTLAKWADTATYTDADTRAELRRFIAKLEQIAAAPDAAAARAIAEFHADDLGVTEPQA